MAFIDEFLRNPVGHPAYQDSAAVRSVLVKEGDYQEEAIGRLQREVARLPQVPAGGDPDNAEAEDNPASRDFLRYHAELKSRLATAKARQGQIMILLQRFDGEEV